MSCERGWFIGMESARVHARGLEWRAGRCVTKWSPHPCLLNRALLHLTSASRA